MIIDPLSDVLKEGSFRNSSKNHLCQSGCLELYVTLGLGTNIRESSTVHRTKLVNIENHLARLEKQSNELCKIL